MHYYSKVNLLTRLHLFDQKYSKNSEILFDLKQLFSMWISVKL